jgi:hypothetical protein
VHGRLVDHLPTDTAYQRFNKRVALWLTTNLGTTTCFWIFLLLTLTASPSILFAATAPVTHDSRRKIRGQGPAASPMTRSRSTASCSLRRPEPRSVIVLMSGLPIVNDAPALNGARNRTSLTRWRHPPAANRLREWHQMAPTVGTFAAK